MKEVEKYASFKKAVFFLCAFCLVLSSCSRERNIKNIGSHGSNIICFGNSLTSGAGASPGNDYPSILAKHIEFPVINAGEAGNTTEDALKRIDQDVLNQDPRLVIVEFGGNDFLRGIPKEKTLKNLDTIVKRIQEAGATVVLIEVRTALIGEAYLSGFKKIAKQRGTILIADILRGILSNPNLKDDYIHPNDEGYQIMAARILNRIKNLKCLKR